MGIILFPIVSHHKLCYSVILGQTSLCICASISLVIFLEVAVQMLGQSVWTFLHFDRICQMAIRKGSANLHHCQLTAAEWAHLLASLPIIVIIHLLHVASLVNKKGYLVFICIFLLISKMRHLFHMLFKISGRCLFTRRGVCSHGGSLFLCQWRSFVRWSNHNRRPITCQDIVLSAREYRGQRHKPCPHEAPILEAGDQ